MKNLIKLFLGVLFLTLSVQGFAQLEAIENPTDNFTGFTINSPTTCGGDNGSIEALGLGNQFVWSDGQVSALASDLSAGNYTVTMTNMYGCSVDSTLMLDGPDYPVIVANPANYSTCEGESVSLSVTATGTSLMYQWYKDTYIVPGANSSTLDYPSVSTANAGNYVCEITSGTCTVSTTSGGDIWVITAPTANAGVDTYVNYPASTSLSASGGGTYLWSTAETTATIVVAPTMITVYTVTVTNSNGCTATDDVVVTVYGSPLLGSLNAAPSVICPGGSSTLNAMANGGNGSYGYVWSTGETTASIVVSPTGTTNYSCTITDGTETIIETTQVVVDVLPTANAGVDQTIALGNTTTIGSPSVPGYTYSWTSYPSGFTASSSQPNVTPTVSSMYTVLVTNTTGCTATDEVTVSVTGGPLVLLPIISSEGSTISNGDQTQLTVLASGGTPPYTYLWSPGTSLSSSGVLNPIAFPTATTTYTVTVTDATTASETGLYTLTVLANIEPTADIGNGSYDQTICAGDNANITVILEGEAPWTVRFMYEGTTWEETTYDSIYVYSFNPTNTDVLSINNIADANFSTGSTSGYAMITVNASPIVDLGSDLTICAGDVTTLEDQSGNTYSYYIWSNTAATVTIDVTPPTSMSYWLEVTENGCSARDSIDITVNDLPIITAGSDEYICEGDSVTLEAFGGSTYFWSTLDNTASITVAPTSNAIYTVNGFDSGCQAVATVSVYVNALPLADAGADQTICNGNAATLNATGGTSYLWSTSDVAASINVMPTTTTVYTVTVTGAGGCSEMATTSVIVVDNPTVNAGIDQAICDGTGITVNLITTNATSIAISPVTGVDDPSSYNPTFSPLVSTTYTVVADNGYGCFINDVITITVNPVPTITASDVATCEGTDIGLNASADVTGCSFIWTPSTGLSNANIPNPVATLATDQLFNIMATSPEGCIGFESIEVAVNPLPFADFSASVLPDSSGIVEFWNASTDATDYSWDFGDGNSSTDSDPIYTYTINGTFNVWLTASNSCGLDSINHIVSGIYIGIEEIPMEAANISMYPNPATTTVNLSGIENVESFQVFNALGQAVRSEQISAFQSRIAFDVNDLEPGAYYVVFSTNKGNSFAKELIVR